MDCICLKRKHRKRREQSKFRPITPQTSPTHSQPSTLGPDARLPKVNSTGLWVGAPSMYTGVAPSPAYYYGPGKMSNKQGPIHSGMIPRASSDTRIPNSGLHYASYKPMYGSHGNLLIMPVVGVQPRIYHSSQPLAPVFEVPPAGRPPSGLEIYDVYQFGGGNSRSKLVEERHTKQYYEEVAKPDSKLARSQSDVQEKTKKLNSRHSRSRDSSASSKKAVAARGKVNRSSSSNSRDKVHQRPAPSPPRASSVILQSKQSNQRNSKEMRLASSAPGYRIGLKSKSLDSLDDNLSRSDLGGGGSYYNNAFDAGFGSGHVSSLSGDIILKPAPIQPRVAASSTPRSDIVLPNGVIAGNVSKPRDNNYIKKEVEVDTSATDSMKLLAKNKTDDQKTVVAVEKSKPPTASNIIIPSSTSGENDTNDIVEDKDLSKGHIHYIYQGDIYAVPEKPVSTPTSENDENPIISRMKEMVVEKTRTNSTKSLSSSREHLNNKETNGLPSSTNNTPRSFNSDSIVIDTEYKKIGDILKAMETHKDEGNADKNVVSALDTDVQLSNGIAEAVKTEKKHVENITVVNRVESSPGNGTGSNLQNGDVVKPSETGDAKDGGLLSPTSPAFLRQHSSGSKTADTTFEEINNAGKRITDSAFEFLNTYLSEDEGGDGHTSP